MMLSLGCNVFATEILSEVSENSNNIVEVDIIENIVDITENVEEIETELFVEEIIEDTEVSDEIDVIVEEVEIRSADSLTYTEVIEKIVQTINKTKDFFFFIP